MTPSHAMNKLNDSSHAMNKVNDSKSCYEYNPQSMKDNERRLANNTV